MLKWQLVLVLEIFGRDLDCNGWMNSVVVVFRLLCREAVVISVKNVSGVVSIDRDDNWVCTDRKNRKTECLPNPVSYFSLFLVLL